MDTKIKKILDLLESAQASISSIKEIIKDAGGLEFEDKTSDFARAAVGISSPKQSSEGNYIEGVFDGEKMIDQEGFTHPVPMNYISKSKLVVGDGLKLIIANDGKFLYKQIKPVPRKYLIGTLTYDNEVYKVIAEGKVYKVILAAITYLKANVGDRISVVVPESGKAEWAAVDAIVPV